MPVIKVWCLPNLEEERLEALFNVIVGAVVSVEELGLTSQRDMVVLFPPDQMAYGLGTEIVIEVTGLLIEIPEVHQRLAKVLGYVVKGFFPSAMVECFVYRFDQAKEGFWASVRESE